MKNLIRSTKKNETNGTRIRSKCNWYEAGETFYKFFLNLEKSREIQIQILNKLIGNIEENEQEDINNELYLYYKKFFNKRKY